MFIAKSRIENFDKCAVGDILFQDPKNKKFEYQLYSRDNRIIMKLKNRPVMPSAIVSVIEKYGLQIQSISVYDDSFSDGVTTTISYTTTPSTSGTWWSSMAGKITSYKK